MAKAKTTTKAKEAKTTKKTTKKTTSKKTTKAKKTTSKAKTESVVQVGDRVKLHYKGTFPDGEQFDSSYDRGKTISVTVGSGDMIAGFEQALEGMEVGETKHIELKAADAYGDYNAAAIAEVSKEIFPESVRDQIEVGIVLPLTHAEFPNKPFPATAKQIKENTVVFDLNHPMAGRDINFDIEVIEKVEVDTTTTPEDMTNIVV
jgi:FKBP-type peptidyl-prolyl cis-trans isomerase 2